MKFCKTKRGVVATFKSKSVGRAKAKLILPFINFENIFMVKIQEHDREIFKTAA